MRIRSNRARDLNKIQSEAYRDVETIRGKADARGAEIYSAACNDSPASVACYEFTRTMPAYKSMISENTTMVLSTDSDLFKFLKGMDPDDTIDRVDEKMPGSKKIVRMRQSHVGNSP